MLKFVIIFLISISCFAATREGLSTVGTITNTSQQSSASWADLGSAAYVGGSATIGLWLSMGINNSSNFRVRAIAKHSTTDDGYVLPIKTVSSNATLAHSTYYELDEDADQRIMLSWDLGSIVNYVQFQTQVSAAGAITARIYDAKITKGLK